MGAVQIAVVNNLVLYAFVFSNTKLSIYLENRDTATQRLSYSPSQLSKKANAIVDSRDVTASASKIVGNWKEFAAHLDPDMFTVQALSVIEFRHQIPLEQAHYMLSRWRDRMGYRATRSLIIEAFLEIEMKEKACKIFGRELVDFVATSSPLEICKSPPNLIE